MKLCSVVILYFDIFCVFFAQHGKNLEIPTIKVTVRTDTHLSNKDISCRSSCGKVILLQKNDIFFYNFILACDLLKKIKKSLT